MKNHMNKKIAKVLKENKDLETIGDVFKQIQKESMYVGAAVRRVRAEQKMYDLKLAELKSASGW